MQNRVERAVRLIDQLIINVDKHENQIDVVERAIFGRNHKAHLKKIERDMD